jgi:heme exporter protein D
MSSISEFFSMGGYGAYVWSGFGITALLMVAEVVIVRGLRQTTLKRLRRIMRMNKQQDSTL